jgi:nitrogen fixation NifU-like protein
LLTEWVKGKTLEQAKQIKNTDIATELALPPVKIHCSVLAEDAIKAAIENYMHKKVDAPIQDEAVTAHDAELHVTN